MNAASPAPRLSMIQVLWCGAIVVTVAVVPKYEIESMVTAAWVNVPVAGAVGSRTRSSAFAGVFAGRFAALGRMPG